MAMFLENRIFTPPPTVAKGMTLSLAAHDGSLLNEVVTFGDFTRGHQPATDKEVGFDLWMPREVEEHVRGHEIGLVLDAPREASREAARLFVVSSGDLCGDSDEAVRSKTHTNAPGPHALELFTRGKVAPEARTSKDKKLGPGSVLSAKRRGNC
jgi:hypothetical protein